MIYLTAASRKIDLLLRTFLRNFAELLREYQHCLAHAAFRLLPLALRPAFLSYLREPNRAAPRKQAALPLSYQYRGTQAEFHSTAGNRGLMQFSPNGKSLQAE